METSFPSPNLIPVPGQAGSLLNQRCLFVMKPAKGETNEGSANQS